MGAPLSRPIERLAGSAALTPAAQRLAALTAGRRGRITELARGQPLGHPLHPAVTDLPIGFWTSAWVIDAVDVISRRRGGRIAQTLVGAGVLTAVPTIVTGLVDVPTRSPRGQRVAVAHAAVNVAATAGFAGSWYLRRSGARTAGIVASVIAGTAASLGGYLGGWLALVDDATGAPSPGGRADDAARLAERVADLIGNRRLAAAESCTAGRIANAIAAGGDAATYFRGSVVSYQEDIKRRHLGVQADSVYSREAAVEMALGVCALLDAEVAVATSGVVGDEPQDGVPPGTVFIATAVDGYAQATAYSFQGSPPEVCDQARDQALRDLAAALERAGSV